MGVSLVVVGEIPVLLCNLFQFPYIYIHTCMYTYRYSICLCVHMCLCAEKTTYLQIRKDPLTRFIFSVPWITACFMPSARCLTYYACGGHTHSGQDPKNPWLLRWYSWIAHGDPWISKGHPKDYLILLIFPIGCVSCHFGVYPDSASNSCSSKGHPFWAIPVANFYLSLEILRTWRSALWLSLPLGCQSLLHPSTDWCLYTL